MKTLSLAKFKLHASKNISPYVTKWIKGLFFFSPDEAQLRFASFFIYEV